MSRPAPPIFPSNGDGKGRSKFKRHVSEEGRARLSELAKARHRAGGFQKSSDGTPRPRKKRSTSKQRVATLVAQAAREKRNAQDIIDVFKDGIADNQPMSIRLKAAEAWIKVEQDDAKLQIRESDSDSQKRDRAELLSLLSERLTNGHAAMLIRRQIEDGGVIDLDPDDVEDIDQSEE